MSVYEQFGTVIKVNAATGIVVFVSGMAAFVFLWLWAFKLVARKTSGWSHVVTRFPMTIIHPLGREYTRQSGDIGCSHHYTRGFTLCLAHEGVCVYPFFARHAPCLIPWKSVESVDVSDGCIFLVVQHERPMQFFLPADALQQVKAYLPAESIRKAVSVFEAMKSG